MHSRQHIHLLHMLNHSMPHTIPTFRQQRQPNSSTALLTGATTHYRCALAVRSCRAPAAAAAAPVVSKATKYVILQLHYPLTPQRSTVSTITTLVSFTQPAHPGTRNLSVSQRPDSCHEYVCLLWLAYADADVT